jgi:hypothetical protein
VFTGRIHEPSARFTVYAAKALGLEIEDLYPFARLRAHPEVLARLDTMRDSLPSQVAAAVEVVAARFPGAKHYMLSILNGLEETMSEEKTKP